MHRYRHKQTQLRSTKDDLASWLLTEDRDTNRGCCHVVIYLKSAHNILLNNRSMHKTENPEEKKNRSMTTIADWRNLHACVFMFSLQVVWWARSTGHSAVKCVLKDNVNNTVCKKHNAWLPLTAEFAGTLTYTNILCLGKRRTNWLHWVG